MADGSVILDGLGRPALDANGRIILDTGNGYAACNVRVKRCDAQTTTRIVACHWFIKTDGTFDTTKVYHEGNYCWQFDATVPQCPTNDFINPTLVSGCGDGTCYSCPSYPPLVTHYYVTASLIIRYYTSSNCSGTPYKTCSEDFSSVVSGSVGSCSWQGQTGGICGNVGINIFWYTGASSLWYVGIIGASYLQNASKNIGTDPTGVYSGIAYICVFTSVSLYMELSNIAVS